MFTRAAANESMGIRSGCGPLSVVARSAAPLFSTASSATDFFDLVFVFFVVDPKNWTVFDQQHTVQKGESTDGKTSNFQTGIQGPRRPPGSDWNEDRRPGLSSASAQ